MGTQPPFAAVLGIHGRSLACSRLTTASPPLNPLLSPATRPGSLLCRHGDVVLSGSQHPGEYGAGSVLQGRAPLAPPSTPPPQVLRSSHLSDRPAPPTIPCPCFAPSLLLSTMGYYTLEQLAGVCMYVCARTHCKQPAKPASHSELGLPELGPCTWPLES